MATPGRSRPGKARLVKNSCKVKLAKIAEGLLDSLLSKNCNPATVTSKWQVPWGKHNPVQWRGQHFAPSSPRSQNVSYVLPVMIVKDPLTWFKSMCRNAYAARFCSGAAVCSGGLRERRTSVGVARMRWRSPYTNQSFGAWKSVTLGTSNCAVPARDTGAADRRSGGNVRIAQALDGSDGFL